MTSKTVSIQRKRRHHHARRHNREQKYLQEGEHLESKDAHRSIENDNFIIKNDQATSGASKPSSRVNILAKTMDIIKGVFQSISSPFKPAIDAKHSQPSKTTVMQNADINGTLLLLDVFIRKITGQKYVSTVDQSMPLLEARGYALSIVEEFEKVVKQAALKSGISMHRLNINFAGVEKEIAGKIIGGKFDEISRILKSYVEKACPGRETGCPGKLSPKKFDKFMAEFNKGLDATLNQSMQQILHGRNSTLEVNDVKEQQISLKPKSYLNDTSVQADLTQTRDLRNQSIISIS